MIVKFKNNFIVPGFGRKRFRKGICRDVPEGLREHLPKSAEVLDDDFPTDKELAEKKEIDAANELGEVGSNKAADAIMAEAEQMMEDAKQYAQDAQEKAKAIVAEGLKPKAETSDEEPPKEEKKKPSRTKGTK